MTLAAPKKKPTRGQAVGWENKERAEKGGLREIGNRRHSPCMCR